MIPARGRSFAPKLIVGFDVGEAVKFDGSRVFDAHVKFQNIVEELVWESTFLETPLRFRSRVV